MAIELIRIVIDILMLLVTTIGVTLALITLVVAIVDHKNKKN